MSNLFCFLDVEIHLDAMGIGDTIKAAKKKIFKNPWDYAKTMIFLYHHLHQALGSEFLAIKNLYILWNGLYERYSHLKSIILPNTRNEWIKLKLQDFKTIDEYNSNVLRITSQLKLCGDKITDEDMREKTFITFPASNIVLQQKFRAQEYKKHSDLISCLLIVEKKNEEV